MTAALRVHRDLLDERRDDGRDGGGARTAARGRQARRVAAVQAREQRLDGMVQRRPVAHAFDAGRRVGGALRRGRCRRRRRRRRHRRCRQARRSAEQRADQRLHAIGHDNEQCAAARRRAFGGHDQFGAIVAVGERDRQRRVGRNADPACGERVELRARVHAERLDGDRKPRRDAARRIAVDARAFMEGKLGVALAGCIGAHVAAPHQLIERGEHLPLRKPRGERRERLRDRQAIAHARGDRGKHVARQHRAPEFVHHIQRAGTGVAHQQMRLETQHAREVVEHRPPVSDTAIDVRGAARATCAGPRRGSPDERLSSR